MSEMSDKELLRLFKSTPWRDDDAYRAFLASLPSRVELKTAKAMMDLLTASREAANDNRQEMRIHIMRQVGARCQNSALFLPLVKALVTGDSRVRELAVSLIPANNNPQEHPRLIALLKSEERSVRRAACEVLKKIGGRTLLMVLEKTIDDKDFADRIDAIDLIVPMAGHHAIPVLTKVLAVGRPAEKQKALAFLGDTRYMEKAPGKALKAILPALEDDVESVSCQAITAFASFATQEDYWEHIGHLLDDPRISLVRSALAGLRFFDSPRTRHAIEKKLRMGPNVVRIEALNTLEAIGNDGVLPLLADALGHPDLSIRTHAGGVLSRLSNQRKVDVARTIIWLLNSQNVEVRRMAVEVARSVSDPDGELWPRLLTMLRDEDWWVRERVMDALVALADTQLTPHMVNMLQDPNDVMRRFAVDVLARLKDSRALGALIQRARDDTDWWVKEKAVDAIAATGDQRGISYIVDLMTRDEDLALCGVLALETLDARSAAQYVASMLTSSNEDVRLAALQCLGKFGAEDYASRVQPLIADACPFVARMAQQLLVQWQVALQDKYTASRDKAVSFLDRLLMAVVDSNGDDLILSSDRPPHMKKMGRIVSLSSTVLSHNQIMAILTPQLSIGQMESLEAMQDVDYSYEAEAGGARFRANVFRSENGYGAVFRTIGGESPKLDALGLPDVVKRFGDKKWGLILVGGPTGSGKSTTLSAIIDYINAQYDRHIITIEDPIEVVHASQKGLVTQRELGTHAVSTAAALRATLREDPDVILVGEMRDQETIAFAVNAAETGHLVFGTLHTVSADTSIDRIINAYPAREQDQVRATLADNLQAVVCQHLLKRRDGNGRVVAAEVLLNTDAVANLIRTGKTYQIPSVIATSREIGMQSMDSELLRLYKDGIISSDMVYMKANSKKEVEDMMKITDEKRQARSASASTDGRKKGGGRGARER